MKTIRLTLFLNFLFLFQAQALAQELMFRTIETNRTTRAQAITDITFTDENVQIHTRHGVTCELPFEALYSQEVGFRPCSGEPEVVKAREKEHEELIQFFSNASDYSITCTLREDEVIGYSFSGRTKVNEKPMLTYKSKAFDLSKYPIPEADKPNALTRLSRQIFKALLEF